jgi:DNA repair exonuclease SbcCD ATPase subunit
MILRGVCVANWRCIGRLELDDLPAGVVVLHGPNRTGKSSLVKALRCCLYDYEHNTRSEEFKKNIPWGTGQPPRVSVEFITRGEWYRVTKVFSPRADGLALLERKVGGVWQVEERTPKEVSRKTRELLGSESSAAGLNQLLWLAQGEVELPSPGKLDASLEKRLMDVLGTLVTGRDLDFKKALDRRCEEWFTPTGALKKQSPIVRLEQQRQERAAALEAEERQYHAVEQAIAELERCEDELPQLQKAVEAAQRELEQLQAERERTEQRRQQHLAAQREYAAAVKALEEVQARLEKWRQAKDRWQESERNVVRAEEHLRLAREARDRCAAEHARALDLLQEARRVEEALLAAREDLDDRRKLLALAQHLATLKQTLQRARELTDEMAELEERIQHTPAPDRTALDKLRANRTEAGKLRAQLQAAGLTLTVIPCQAVKCHLQLDNQPRRAVELHAERTQRWTLRQRAVIAVPEFGVIELARGQDNQDLERAAQRLAELDRHFAETIRAYQEDPADEGCLDRLTERRVHREMWINRLDAARQELQQLTPHGVSVLDRRARDCENQRRVLLERRTDLADWQPTPEDVKAREQAFTAKAAELHTQRKAAEQAEAQARQALQQAEAQAHQAKDQLTDTRATAKALLEGMQYLGDELALQAELKQAESAVAAARRRLAETELTAAEKTIEERCHAAERAVAQRTERVRRLEDQLNQLRGRLHGSEGLHIQRANAAAALAETDQALVREKLDAEAHRRLRELFEECRERQVQQVMGPISARVLEWTKHLGLDEYHDIRFGDRFLPESFVLANGHPETAICLDEESYGTEEQLSLLVRLALGGVLAKDEPHVVILDDPLAHADPLKHRRLLDILRLAAAGNPSAQPPAGPLQVLILTCHPDRFDHLPDAHHIDLARAIQRAS